MHSNTRESSFAFHKVIFHLSRAHHLGRVDIVKVSIVLGIDKDSIAELVLKILTHWKIYKLWNLEQS